MRLDRDVGAGEYFTEGDLKPVFMRPEEMVEFCQEPGLGMTLDISHAQLNRLAYERL